jgi:hypothetical protein
MTDDLRARLEELGWGIELDEDRGEISLVHSETENEFVLDDQGNLTVPGDEDVGDDLRELHSLLTSALEAYSDPASRCSIDCEEPVRIESGERIALEAPEIVVDAGNTLDLSAGGAFDMSAGSTLGLSAEGALDMISGGNMNAESGGVLSLQGALLQLN